VSNEGNNGVGVAKATDGAEQAIGAKLRADLVAKRDAYAETAREFDDFCLHVQDRSINMSASDGAMMVATMAQRQRAAFEKYKGALHSYTAFVLGGIVGRPGFEAMQAIREPRVTERELQVLRQLAAGKTTKEIARDLKIAFKTALTHRSHLLQKFDANNVALLVSKAITQGYIEQ
jgi:DNA-binding CsgD family transcriptional regulator